MNTKRGRPKGKKYPQPHNIYEGMWVASFGKLGASQAMRVILFCPFSEIDRIQEIPPKSRTRWDKQILRWDLRYLKKWNREIGTVVGQRIAARDHDFFRQIADALEEVSKENHLPCDKDRRHLALDHKLDCHIDGKPFNLKGLRDVYRRNGVKIDSSTLSKLYRWAQSAEWRKIPRTLVPLYLESVRN